MFFELRDLDAGLAQRIPGVHQVAVVHPLDNNREALASVGRHGSGPRLGAGVQHVPLGHLHSSCKRTNSSSKDRTVPRIAHSSALSLFSAFDLR